MIRAVCIIVFCIASVHTRAADFDFGALLAQTPHPTNVAEFKLLTHLPVQQQGRTSLCWSYATCSFLESEMARLKREPVRLSVTFPEYWGYIEKARRFVQTRGASRFSAGDLFTGVLEVYRKYGAIPDAVYGRCEGNVPNHGELDAELKRCLDDAKQRQAWDERAVLAKVENILKRHLGEPPGRFSFAGSRYTPRSFADKVVNVPLNDYRLVTSFEYAPFDTHIELTVPDNWWHCSNYCNVPLDRFYKGLKSAVESGFTVAVDADISEPSYKTTKRFAIVPPADCSWAKIDQQSREEPFANGSTTDDHMMHIVGFGNFSGEDWFVLKDTWHIAWEDGGNGYIFLHKSYVQLKTLAFLVHKDALPKLVTEK